MTVRIINADVMAGLAMLEDESVNCCVTSPPYWGLRDYGVEGQIGLEATPDEFVARMVEVFREVRRVLRKDGTCWINLGDSYAGSWGAQSRGNATGEDKSTISGGSMPSARQIKSAPKTTLTGSSKRTPGIKPKDLVGIPWAVATALRDPYYAGQMKSAQDRTWLAALMDGEGTICGFHHLRQDDGSPRTGVNITITNSHIGLLDEAHRIWPTSRSIHNSPSDNRFGTRVTYRWIVHGIRNKIQFIREIYPHLIAKKKQALVGYNLLLLMADAKRLGKTPQKDAIRERRRLLTDLMSSLNQQDACDLPSWLVEPPSVNEPGWYLRQEIIWSKPNPMPESVKDRCTKSHEHLFLLSKGSSYFYDAEAIRSPSTYDADNTKMPDGWDTGAGAHGHFHKAGRQKGERKTDKQRGHGRRHDGFNDRWDAMDKSEQQLRGANKRSVWSIATTPYADAHFATFPEELPETCIKAGCPIDGTVLDPFGGAGTTGLVADKLCRHAVLIELNPEYAAMAERRIRSSAPMFANVMTTKQGVLL